MKLHISILLFVFLAITANTVTDDALYLNLECESGQACIDLPHGDMGTESVRDNPICLFTLLLIPIKLL